jgi:hypothetical protein
MTARDWEALESRIRERNGVALIPTKAPGQAVTSELVYDLENGPLE